MQDNPHKTPDGWFSRHFKSHPQSVGECYFRHLWFSLRTGAHMIFYALCLILHGFLPFLCERTASDYTCRLYEEMKARRDKAGCDKPADV